MNIKQYVALKLKLETRKTKWMQLSRNIIKEKSPTPYPNNHKACIQLFTLRMRKLKKKMVEKLSKYIRVIKGRNERKKGRKKERKLKIPVG